MSDTEVMPNTWCKAKISEITAVNPTLDKAGIPDDLDVSFVPMPAVQAENGIIDVSGIRKFSEVRKGYTPFREGDVLFAKITPCMENGKMAVVPQVRNGIGFGSTEFHVLRAQSGVCAKYVYYYVSSQPFRRVAEHNMSGAVGQRRVTTPYLSACDAPLPPTNEQHRVVAKIEELFSELDKGIENLKTARVQLKVYRQALLKHAFEGKLTAQWRAENQDKLETADTLLKRIQQERAQRYQQQLTDWQKSPSVPLLQRGKPTSAAASVPHFEKGGLGGISVGTAQLPKPKAPKPLSPLTAEELAELPELPEGWAYTRVGALIDDPAYGTSKKCDYEIEGVGVLRIPNVISGKVDASDLKFAQFTPDEIATYKLSGGDILIIRSNGSVSIVGRCALVSDADVDYLYAGYLIRLRPILRLVEPGFLLNTFSLHAIRKQIEQKAKSTSGVNNINTGEIQSLVVALCGIEEQKQIQMEIEARLSKADQLDQTITTSLQQAEALRQSILKKAFSGQLVPQDPHDEPASALLARIKAENMRHTEKSKKSMSRSMQNE